MQPCGVCFGDGVQPEAMCGGALKLGAEGHHIWPASWQGYNQLLYLVDLFSKKMLIKYIEFVILLTQ